ncbi:MAG: hypothetical protein U0892_20555 [Pirellulales bacterium]
MRVGLTFDFGSRFLAQGTASGNTPREGAEETLAAVCSALSDAGHDAVLIGDVSDLVDKLAAGDRWDLVFNLCEGTIGRGASGQIPALLEAYGIPFTFADITSRCIAENAPTLKSVLVEVGVAVAEESDSPGREFTVCIVGHGSASEVLGVLECASVLDVMLSDRDAESTDAPTLAQIADTSDPEVMQAQRLALSAWQAVGGCDAGEVDLQLDESGSLQVVDVKLLPDLYPVDSAFSTIADAAGISYGSLIQRIIDEAQSRGQSAKSSADRKSPARPHFHATTRLKAVNLKA